MSVAPQGDVVAKVGKGGVTVEAFVGRAIRTPGAASNEVPLEARRDILMALVSEEALWQEAMEKELYRDPKVRKIMVNLLLREEIYAKVSAGDFAPEQIQAYFEEHRDEFTVPEKIQVKRIFLRVGGDRTLAEAKALAGDLREQLVAQPDRFKDLAAEHSDGPYKRRGGDLGYLSKEGKPGIEPDVVARAFELEVGDVSEPFEAADGVNLVAVVSRRERVERTFEQMKGSVLRKLKNERYRELEQSYISSIEGKFQIEIDDAKLGAVDLAEARSANRTPVDEVPDGQPPEPMEAAPAPDADLGLDE